MFRNKFPTFETFNQHTGNYGIDKYQVYINLYNDTLPITDMRLMEVSLIQPCYVHLMVDDINTGVDVTFIDRYPTYASFVGTLGYEDRDLYDLLTSLNMTNPSYPSFIDQTRLPDTDVAYDMYQRLYP